MWWSPNRQIYSELKLIILYTSKTTRIFNKYTKRIKQIEYFFQLMIFFLPFLRKPASPKSDEILTLNLTNDTHYSADTGSHIFVYLFVQSSFTTLTFNKSVLIIHVTCIFYSLKESLTGRLLTLI